MPSVFLSHTSLDKPFVEKLANNLRNFGVNVWFDKWEIRVGESITWKIEEGIRENEFLAIVLSPEALDSEWVKTEIGSAWIRQMSEKRVFVLPILYRDCSLPLFLTDKKYADFRKDYDAGLAELLDVLGIRNRDALRSDNWRKFTHRKAANWQMYREKEFEELVKFSVDEARKYNWSIWVGGRYNAPFTIVFLASSGRETAAGFAIRLDKRRHYYIAAPNKLHSTPNTIHREDFTDYVGNTIDECQEFVWRRFQDFESDYGRPTDRPSYYVYKFLSRPEKSDMFNEMFKSTSWYKGSDRSGLD